MEHEGAIVRVYAPDFGAFVWRCFIENMKSFELELWGRKLQEVDVQQLLQAGLATATGFLSEPQLGGLRALLKQLPELVVNEHGGQAYRFARFIADDAAVAILAKELPDGELDRPVGEVSWAD